MEGNEDMERRIKREAEDENMITSAQQKDHSEAANTNAAQQREKREHDVDLMPSLKIEQDTEDDFVDSEPEEQREMPVAKVGGRPTKNKRIPIPEEEAICGNPFCHSKNGHRVADCMAVDVHGVINGCPWCNQDHHWWLCPDLSKVTLVKLFYYLVSRRHGKPQIRSPVNMWDIWVEKWQESKARPQTVAYTLKRGLKRGRYQTHGNVVHDPSWRDPMFRYTDQFRAGEGLDMEKDILPKLKPRTEPTAPKPPKAVPEVTPEAAPEASRGWSTTRGSGMAPPPPPATSNTPPNAPTGPRSSTPAPARGSRYQSVSSRYRAASTAGSRDGGLANQNGGQRVGSTDFQGNQNQGGWHHSHSVSQQAQPAPLPRSGLMIADISPQNLAYLSANPGLFADILAATSSRPSTGGPSSDSQRQEHPSPRDGERRDNAQGSTSQRDQAREQNRDRRHGKENYRRGWGRRGGRGGGLGGGGSSMS